MKKEILAPAGSMESLLAGVRCGANAVYLGGKSFSARANAGNFDVEELEEAVRYCHVRGVKVYLTLNTLVKEKELELALFAAQTAVNLGVDGLIVQDLGLAYCVRLFFPTVPLHASTQISVMSESGFAVLESLGFCRGVVPRELSEQELVRIHQSTAMELEAFVHGALCMCVSGQCYLSAMFGSRSGNRGLCAQPCRLPFFVEDATKCDLSLKDLSLISKSDALSKAGVFSFKIEGRMKRPEYVAAAVTACKEASEQGLTPKTAQVLQSVFSRSGFTDGYFAAQLGATMFGTRQKEDVISAKGVLGELAGLYKNETPLIPVSFVVDVVAGEPLSIAVSASGKNVFMLSDVVPEVAINKPMSEEALVARMSKCGGTPFYAKSVEVQMDEGLIVPASALNALRREALDALAKKLEAVPTEEQYKYTTFPLSVANQTRASLSLRATFDSYHSVPCNVDKLDWVYLPLRESVTHFHTLGQRGIKVGVQLPRGMFGNEAQITQKLKELYVVGVTTVLTGNLGGVQLGKKLGFTVHGDFGLNVFNSQAMAVLESLGVISQTLSFELKVDELATIKGQAIKGAILYGRVPLMLTRNCPIKNEKDCKSCNRMESLIDRKGISFPIRCDYGCSELLNSRPIYMADRMGEVPVDFGTLSFTIETKEECHRVIEAYLAGDAPCGEFTRGLYYRGVE